MFSLKDSHTGNAGDAVAGTGDDSWKRAIEARVATLEKDFAAMKNADKPKTPTPSRAASKDVPLDEVSGEFGKLSTPKETVQAIQRFLTNPVKVSCNSNINSYNLQLWYQIFFGGGRNFRKIGW